MAKVDFISLANIIFKDKHKYKNVTDDEKIDNFFILNRKFAFKYPKQAQFFNNKNIDKASAIDVWYQIFYKATKGTPVWWWKTNKKRRKEKSKFSNKDLKFIKEYYSLNDNDIVFLETYYENKMKEDIKRLKKFEQK
jgi:hypothetical protein